MFHKPLDGILSLSGFCLRDNINGMYKKVEQSPKNVFFPSFGEDEQQDTKLDALNMIFQQRKSKDNIKIYQRSYIKILLLNFLNDFCDFLNSIQAFVKKKV